MSDTRAYFLSLVLEPNEDGYLASVPGLQGAFAEGDAVEEAVFNCIDVAKLITAYRAERGEAMGLSEVEITPNTRLAITVPVGVSGPSSEKWASELPDSWRRMVTCGLGQRPARAVGAERARSETGPSGKNRPESGE